MKTVDMVIDTNLGMRDEAFLCYYFIKFDQPGKSIPYIERSAGEVHSFHDAVYWLWIFGEYVQAAQDLSLMERYRDDLEDAVSLIGSKWKSPQRHWLSEAGGSEGIYTGNLAMAYSALLAVNHQLRSEQVQLWLKQIRELLFAKLIKEGKVVSQLGSTRIQGDIVMAAMPFGMLGIEDRILIEALYVMEVQLVGKGVRLSDTDTYFGGCERADLTCMLAWYYSEKGDLAKAKRLIEHVEEQLERDGDLHVVDRETTKEELFYRHWLEEEDEVPLSPLSRILYAIVQSNMNLKQQSGASSAVAEKSVVKFLHLPSGMDDPYVFANYERSPRYPLSGDRVVVSTVTEPFAASRPVSVVWTLNGAAQKPLSMSVKQSAAGEKFLQAELGVFGWADQVEYAFRVEDDGLETVSETYRFAVREWQPLHKVRRITTGGEAIRLEFDPLDSDAGEVTPVLTLSRETDERLKLSFCAERDAAESAISVEAGATWAAYHPSLAASPELKLGAHTVKFEKRADGLGFGIYHEQKGLVGESYHKHGESFADVLVDGSGNIHKFKWKLAMQDGERWFGMGERYSRLQYRGYDVDNYVHNEYRDQGLKTYMPNPFAISSAGYGFYLDTWLYSKFRFGTTLADLLEVEVDLLTNHERSDLHLFLGKPLEIIRQFTDVTGKPLLPPKWSFGPWMSSNNWDSQAEVLKQVELTKRYQIPSTVIVLEQWSDEATFYIFNDAQYEAKDGHDYLRYDDFSFPEWGRWPNPKGMVDQLHHDGLKVLLWQIPIHKHLYGIAHPQKDQDEQAMLAAGYPVKRRNGEPYRIPYNWFKDCLILDFTNPGARKWWFRKRQYLLDEVGVDGFKTDGGECVYGNDLLFDNGATGAEMRNLYPNAYIGSYFDFVREYVRDGLTFSRAGYSGAQRIPLHWAGDERSTYDAFRSSIVAGLTSGMSGVPFWGWDLGGFHGDIPTAELFIRSTQMAAFCPIMQYHAESKGEFNQDRTPWNIAERTGMPLVLDLYKKFADMRMNLLPYIYEQAVISSTEGIPMMQAMFAAYPEDPSCTELAEQYMFGDCMLVAPVTREGEVTKEIYFPKGKWISLFENVEVTGSCMRKSAAALPDIPVFIKGDRIIPLNLTKTYKLGSHVGNQTNCYDQLTFMIYVTDLIQYRFSDDLGHVVDIRVEKQPGKLLVTVSKLGDSAITLIFRNVQEVAEVVTVNDKLVRVGPSSLHVDTYCIEKGDLYIKADKQQEQWQIDFRN